MDKRKELLFSHGTKQTSSRLVLDHHFDLAEVVSRAVSTHRIAIITDEHVASFLGSPLQLAFIHRGVSADLFLIPPGEGSKTREQKAKLEDQMFEKGYGRDTTIIGLGGGVVTDLTGFLAATFCRGIPWIAIPTTLMGMVDAAIGGKTGVNTPHAKNTIGAFHPPELILIDTLFLQHLDERAYKSGAAEIIKYALIASRDLFDLLMYEHTKWKQKDPSLLADLILKSIQIKVQITTSDPFDQGQRRILNYGHTIGHALERVANFHLPHGEAVAMGLAVESTLSHALELLTQDDVESILSLLKLYDLPTKIPPAMITEPFWKALTLDKKNTRGLPSFVTLDAIGHASSYGGTYCRPVDPTLLQSHLHLHLEDRQKLSFH